MVPLPFGSRLRAATGNFETRANANCIHRSCEVRCWAHNNHRSANKLRRMPARLVRAWPDSFVPFLATRRLHARRHAGNTTSRVQTLSTATKRRQKKRQKRDQIPGSLAQAKTTQALCCPKRSTAQNPGSDPGPDSGFEIRPVSNRHLQP